ncbi:MAG: hypothetical protein HY553_07140 [Elusimicrobia bacterium]|nr:hypothetical protein [Elusimicrobiota bacterium]
MLTFAALWIAAASPALAADCARARSELAAAVRSAYDVDRLRGVARRVAQTTTAAEASELATLSARFNATAHDTPAHINDRFAMQGRGRELARAITERAGYRFTNRFDGPYDAVIEEWQDAQHIPAAVVEVRELLVLADPLPHVTVWVLRWDARRNPWGLVTLGIRPEAQDDYASWRGADGRRVSGSFDEFVSYRLPNGCR